MLNTELDQVRDAKDELSPIEAKFKIARDKLSGILQTDLGTKIDSSEVLGKAYGHMTREKAAAAAKSQTYDEAISEPARAELQAAAVELTEAQRKVKAAEEDVLQRAKDEAYAISISNDSDRVQQLTELIRQLKGTVPGSEDLAKTLQEDLNRMKADIINQIGPVLENYLKADPTIPVADCIDYAMAKVLGDDSDLVIRSELNSKASWSNYENIRKSTLVDFVLEKVKARVRTGEPIEDVITDEANDANMQPDEVTLLRKKYSEITVVENETKTKETAANEERLKNNAQLLERSFEEMVAEVSDVAHVRDVNLKIDTKGGTKRFSFDGYFTFSESAKLAQSDGNLKTGDVEIIKEAEGKAIERIKTAIDTDFTDGTGRFGKLVAALTILDSARRADQLSPKVYAELTNYVVESRNKLAEVYMNLALPGISYADWKTSAPSEDARIEAERRLDNKANAEDNANFKSIKLNIIGQIKQNRLVTSKAPFALDQTQVDTEIVKANVTNWAEIQAFIGPIGRIALDKDVLAAVALLNTAKTEAANRAKTEKYINEIAKEQGDFPGKIQKIQELIDKLEKEPWFSPTLAFMARERITLMESLVGNIQDRQKGYESEKSWRKLGQVMKWGGIAIGSGIAGIAGLGAIGGILGPQLSQIGEGYGLLGILSLTGHFVPKILEMKRRGQEEDYKRKLNTDIVTRSKGAVLRLGEELAKTFTTQDDSKVEAAMDRAMGTFQSVKFSV